jgi:hypothetical protein
MKRLKLVAQALKPSNLARGIELARNPPSQEEIDAALAQMSPEDRARAQESIERAARVQAEERAAAERTLRELRVLEGPAGAALYGAHPDELTRIVQERGMAGALQHQKSMFKQAYGRGGPRQIVEPGERAQRAAQELAERDAARTPYRSPHAVPVEIRRLPTRGKSQVQEVLSYLNGSGLAPERIFGVYRVPDRTSQAITPGSEKGRLVEWDIVHSPGGGTPRQLVATAFAADEQWVAKRIGEPSVLDEDLALAFCLGAGIAPEHCAGIARVCEFRALKGSSSETGTPSSIRTLVRGVVAFHPADGTGTYERMRTGAPLLLGSPADVWIEVLNWGAIAGAVHPRVYDPPPIPSPFPYLPATPQELLQAYLDVVGVQPGDCYSAQATVHRPRPIAEHRGVVSTNIGPKLPCADGKARMRAHGGEHVVIVYRDRQEYAAGRERWDAYQRDVLQGDLRRGLALRDPVQDPNSLSDLPRFLRPLMRTAETLSRLHPDNWFDDVWDAEEVNPHRYCWPPLR